VPADPERSPGCLPCTLDEAGEETVVFRDELWAAQISPGYELPGWYILRVRRHAERLTGLNEAELGTLAYRARDLVAAVTEVTGADATYLFVFGENNPHFHALITPRGAQVPDDRRTGDILKLRLERPDPAGARQLLPAVRAAYTRAAASRLAGDLPR
jgi:diadenosine tetraphosphate (Ap4A) HIT family hydrolase